MWQPSVHGDAPFVNANNIERGERGAQPVQWQNGVGRGGAEFRPSTVERRFLLRKRSGDLITLRGRPALRGGI